jgi:hypothetical protein
MTLVKTYKEDASIYVDLAMIDIICTLTVEGEVLEGVVGIGLPSGRWEIYLPGVSLPTFAMMVGEAKERRQR